MRTKTLPSEAAILRLQEVGSRWSECPVLTQDTLSHRKQSGRWRRDGAAAPQDPAIIYFSTALFWSTSVSYTLQLAPGGTLWKSTGFWEKVQRFMSQLLLSLAMLVRTHILEPVRGLPQKQAGAGNLSSWSSTVVTVPSKVTYGDEGKLSPDKQHLQVSRRTEDMTPK